MTQLVLASASPARLAVLRAAGVSPLVRVSGVDEDKIADNLGPDAAPEKVVTVLAEAKAAEIVPGLAADNLTDVVVVGCDSMLLIDGQLQGKPGSVDIARKRWAAMAGRSATLLTGHCVLRVADGRIVRMASDHSATVVHFRATFHRGSRGIPGNGRAAPSCRSIHPRQSRGLVRGEDRG